MTTITDIYNEDTRSAYTAVRIAGILLSQPVDVTWQFTIGKVPTATVRVPYEVPAMVGYLATVTVDLVLGGLSQRCFTGVVQDTDRDETGAVIRCVGMSWPLDVEYQDVLITLNGQDVNTAIESLLDDAGILDYSVAMPTWAVGSVVQQTLEFGTYAEAISKLAEVDGGRWWETPLGTVLVAPADPLPSLAAARAYFSGVLTAIVESYPPGIASGRPRLRRCGQAQAVRETKNKVLVRGATITTTAADGTELSADIESLVSAPSPYVLHADGSQAYNTRLFANELIDTQVKADEVAMRLLVLENRLHKSVAATIDGDPRVQLRETLQIEDPEYSHTTGNWFVEGYQTQVHATTCQTQLLLLGQGAATNQDPIAEFAWRVDREWMTDREWVIVTLDARPSYDTDGSIASYSWSDNQTPDIATGTASVITVRADPSTLVTPWLVTLLVTDNDGATASITKEVRIDPGEVGVTVPAFFTAFDVSESASPDGGEHWYDQTETSVISVGASPDTSGLAVFGLTSGALYRTTDFCQTALTLVMAAVGSPIVDVYWDTNDALRVWAATLDGRVYGSVDQGLTWALWDNLRVALEEPALVLNRLDTPRSVGRQLVRAYGGSGAGLPLIAFDRMDAPHNWQRVFLGGELLADLDGGSPAASMYVADGGYLLETEVAIVLNDPAFTPAVYYTQDVYGDGSAWKRGTAAPAKSRGRWMDADLEQGKFCFAFNDTVIYRGDVTAGVLAVTVAPAALDANDAPNHGLWMGRFIDGLAKVYVVSAEGTAAGTLYKTYDRFATIGKLRPATGVPAPPANANAKMTAIGPEGSPGDDLFVTRSPFAVDSQNYPRQVARLSGSSWSLVHNPASAIQQSVYFMRRLPANGGNLFRLYGSTYSGSYNAMHPGQLQRSTDNGVTWANVGPTPVIDSGDEWGINEVEAGADGTLWAAACSDSPANNPALPFPRIYKSADAGATWTQVYEDTTVASGLRRRIIGVAPHPNNANVIAMIGDHPVGQMRTWITVNGGSSWSVNSGAAGQSANGLRRAVMMDNGRIVMLFPGFIYYSDDYGSTAWTLTGAALSTFHFGIWRFGTVLLVVDGSSTVPRILRSRDYGATWEVIVQELTNTAAEPQIICGLAYSASRDRLYIATDVSQATTLRVVVLDDPLDGAFPSTLDLRALEDVTFNLPDLFGTLSARRSAIGLQGITL